MNPFEHTTVARLAYQIPTVEARDNGKAVVILATSKISCLVKICHGSDQWGKKEFWIKNENLRKF